MGGFTDGDACFSISKFGPRLKFENHEKELELFQSIKEYLNCGNLNILSSRKNLRNSNPMVVLEINNIHALKNLILPLYNNNSNFNILNSKKYLDFCDWSILVCIFFYGFHRLPEGISLINEIKSYINNFRLTTSPLPLKAGQAGIEKKKNSHTKTDLYSAESNDFKKEGHNLSASFYNYLASENKHIESSADYLRLVSSDIFKQDSHLPSILSNLINNLEKIQTVHTVILFKFFYLFSLPSPYEIKNGVRYLRGTNNLVSEKLKVIAIGPLVPSSRGSAVSYPSLGIGGEGQPYLTQGENNKFTYSSISECSKALKIGRTNIKNCIISGQTYKNYKFIFGL